MTIEKLLRLGILFDADKGANQGGSGAGGTTDDDPNPTDVNPTDDKDDKDDKSDSKGANGGGSNDKPTGTEPGDKSDGEPKTFTQEELDRIIADRLARERKKQEEKAEQERLKEAGKYKELYEAQQQEILGMKKATLLKDAGYTEEQAELFADLVKGETDEELTQSVEKLKEANPPFKRDYADPSTGNGRKQEPPKKDASEAGKSLFQRLKEKGKVR